MTFHGLVGARNVRTLSFWVHPSYLPSFLIAFLFFVGFLWFCSQSVNLSVNKEAKNDFPLILNGQTFIDIL